MLNNLANWAGDSADHAPRVASKLLCPLKNVAEIQPGPMLIHNVIVNVINDMYPIGLFGMKKGLECKVSPDESRFV